VRPAIELAHYQSQLRHAFYFNLEPLDDRMVLLVPWLGFRLESGGMWCRLCSIADLVRSTTSKRLMWSILIVPSHVAQQFILEKRKGQALGISKHVTNTQGKQSALGSRNRSVNTRY